MGKITRYETLWTLSEKSGELQDDVLDPRMRVKKIPGTLMRMTMASMARQEHDHDSDESDDGDQKLNINLRAIKRL